jgi:hypothetical protein
MDFLDVIKDLLAHATKKIDEGNPRPMVERDVWNILSSIRGQDKDGKEMASSYSHALLKRFSTGRIRGILGVDSIVAIVEDVKLIDNQIKDRNRLLNEIATSHFKNHFAWAMKSLSELGYDVPAAELEGLSTMTF